MDLLEIEKELNGPDGEAAVERYDQMLLTLSRRLAQSLSEGMSPDDYSSATQLKDAVLVARKLLRLSRQKKS